MLKVALNTITLYKYIYINIYGTHLLEIMVMVFNATFNNISVISWRSVLLVEETEVPGKTTDLPQVTDLNSQL